MISRHRRIGDREHSAAHVRQRGCRHNRSPVVRHRAPVLTARFCDRIATRLRRSRGLEDARQVNPTGRILWAAERCPAARNVAGLTGTRQRSGGHTVSTGALATGRASLSIRCRSSPDGNTRRGLIIATTTATTASAATLTPTASPSVLNSPAAPTPRIRVQFLGIGIAEANRRQQGSQAAANDPFEHRPPRGSLGNCSRQIIEPAVVHLIPPYNRTVASTHAPSRCAPAADRTSAA